jgi:hypothetical protein
VPAIRHRGALVSERVAILLYLADLSYAGGCHCGAVRFEADIGLSIGNFAALDNVDPTELVGTPIEYMDGRNDSWRTRPGRDAAPLTDKSSLRRLCGV